MCGPRTPIVSTAIGEKRCSGVRLTYLATFLSSASAATAPASLVAALAEERKVAKYVNLTPEQRDLGRRVTQTTGEEAATTHLVQRLSVAVQRGNCMCLSDGHHRPTRFWPFLLTKLPTQNVILFIYIYVLNLFVPTSHFEETQKLCNYVIIYVL